MQYIKGKIGLFLHKILSNLHYISAIIIGILFITNMLFYKSEEVNLEDVLLDKTFENVDEIYINNEFGKSIILKVPHRSRIIVHKKELNENNSFLIRVDVLK
jgi:hypothetical protein